MGNEEQEKLRTYFFISAPVFAIFWHHILFQTPIFDVYTHMAYYWDVTGQVLRKGDAKIKVPHHWQIYDQYRDWFNLTLTRVQGKDNSISER